MSKSQTILIQTSARATGDSGFITRQVINMFNCDSIDLCTLDIHPFDYENRHADDDFLPTVREIVENYNTIIFITPVYWYTMSARMKIFLDRISDLLKWEKDTGRQFRGKTMGLISVSNDPDLNACFHVPVALSADYLGMKFMGHFHCPVHKGDLLPEVRQNLADYLGFIS